MPLIIPDKLPAVDTLNRENIFTMKEQRAITQDIRPLKIVIVNLMPTKIATETQLARLLANSPLQVSLTLVQMSSHKSQNVKQDHLDAFYTVIDKIKTQRFDGMILTGAPVELLDFEDVDYWEELCEIFEYSKKNVYSVLHLCWGALAGLYYNHGIKKYPLENKLSGIYEHDLLKPLNPLVRGFEDKFYAPHSRNSYVKSADIEKDSDLRILASSEVAGPHIISTEQGRQIYVLGHPEYDKDTLKGEYIRDLNAGLKPNIPENYFLNNNPDSNILYRWKSHSNLLFLNWLNYYLYQSTPYDLHEL